MQPEDEPRVRELHALAHPRAAQYSPRWYFTHPTLVAEREARILGAVSVSVGFGPYQTLGSAEVMYGCAVYVDPAARNQGIGRRLVAAVVDLARVEGLRGVITRTQKDNAPMRRVNEALGFTLYGSVNGAYVYPGDVGGDEILYTLDFNHSR